MTAAHRRTVTDAPAGEPGRADGAGGRGRRPEGRTRTVALTSCADELEHQIALDALEHAAGEPGSVVVACCGAGVLPAPLSTPPGAPCRRCADLAARPSASRRASTGAGGPSTWWARRTTAR